MQSDGDALYRAILEDPLDQVMKLVYADYLDETAGRVVCPNKGRGCNQPAYNCPACHGSGQVSDGRTERAELIRLQIELGQEVETLDNYAIKVCRKDYLLQTWGRRWALETVAAHLEPLHRGRFLRWNGIFYGTRWGRAGYGWEQAATPVVTWKWMDGFVVEVELSGDDWVRYAAKMWWHPEWRFGNDAYEGGRVSYQPYNPLASPLRRVVLKSALRDHQRPGTYPEIQSRLRMDYKPLQLIFSGEPRG